MWTLAQLYYRHKTQSTLVNRRVFTSDMLMKVILIRDSTLMYRHILIYLDISTFREYRYTDQHI